MAEGISGMRSIAYLCFPALIALTSCGGFLMAGLNDEPVQEPVIPPEPPRYVERPEPVPPDSADPAALEKYKREKAEYEEDKRRVEENYANWVLSKQRAFDEYNRKVKEQGEEKPFPVALKILGIVFGVVCLIALGGVLIWVYKSEKNNSGAEQGTWSPMSAATGPLDLPVLGLRF